MLLITCLVDSGWNISWVCFPASSDIVSYGSSQSWSARETHIQVDAYNKVKSIKSIIYVRVETSDRDSFDKLYTASSS